jgi:hypothetical protein
MNKTAPKTVALKALPVLMRLVLSRKQARWQWRFCADEHKRTWVLVLDILDKRIFEIEKFIGDNLEQPGFHAKKGDYRMNKGYRELVGLQVTFDKSKSRYTLTHYYRFKIGAVLGPVLEMQGYEMDRTLSIEDIKDGLQKAYAPAILSVWNRDAETVQEHYLQFQPGSQPVDLHFDPGWKLWAQW